MKYLWEHKNELENKLYVLPEELNTEIAALKLQAMGVGIDKLTPGTGNISAPGHKGSVNLAG